MIADGRRRDFFIGNRQNIQKLRNNEFFVSNLKMNYYRKMKFRGNVHETSFKLM